MRWEDSKMNFQFQSKKKNWSIHGKTGDRLAVRSGPILKIGEPGCVILILIEVELHFPIKHESVACLCYWCELQ